MECFQFVWLWAACRNMVYRMLSSWLLTWLSIWFLYSWDTNCFCQSWQDIWQNWLKSVCSEHSSTDSSKGGVRRLKVCLQFPCDILHFREQVSVNYWMNSLSHSEGADINSRVCACSDWEAWRKGNGKSEGGAKTRERSCQDVYDRWQLLPL